MSSMRGPKESAQSFLKMLMTFETTRPRCFAAAVEQVEREGAVPVFGIEIDNVVRPVAGDVVLQNVLHQLAVRIDDGDAVPGKDVLGEHVPHERTLARAAGAEERKMASPRGRYDVHRHTEAVGIFAAADEDGIERHGKGILKL
jgi:hypothetical protein